MTKPKLEKVSLYESTGEKKPGLLDFLKPKPSVEENRKKHLKALLERKCTLPCGIKEPHLIGDHGETCSICGKNHAAHLCPSRTTTSTPTKEESARAAARPAFSSPVGSEKPTKAEKVPNEQKTEPQFYEEASEPIIGKTKKWLFSTQEEINDTMKPPFLLLIRENRTGVILQDVQSGPLEIKDKHGHVRSHLLLQPNKLIGVKWGIGYVNMWVAYEKEAVPYPVEVEHDAEGLYGLLMNVLMLAKNYQANKNSGNLNWMWTVGIILVLLFLIVAMFGDGRSVFDFIAGSPNMVGAAVNATTSVGV